MFGLGFPSEAELNKVGSKTSSEFSPCMQPCDKSAVNLYLVILTLLFPGSLPLPLGKRETLSTRLTMPLILKTILLFILSF